MRASLASGITISTIKILEHYSNDTLSVITEISIFLKSRLKGERNEAQITTDIGNVLT